MSVPPYPKGSLFALLVVCLLWGTTYLGIRIALETLPALYLIAIRYTISGGLMLLGAFWANLRFPTGRQSWQTAGCGAICIGIGNGLLAIAEKNGTASGLAALFYSTAPFWLVGFDAILPDGQRPSLGTLRGLLIGVAGVVLLVLPSAWHEGIHGAAVSGFLLLQISAAGWTFGALLQKRVRTSANALVIGGFQQLGAGLVTFLPAGIFESMPHVISSRSLSAVAYLVVFGSLVGFSCFVYSVATLPVPIVSIYTFVNPVVALLLGAVLMNEPLTAWQFVSMLVIFAGIVFIRRAERQQTSSKDTAAPLQDLQTLGPES